MTASRLEILKASLAKKEAAFDAKLAGHFATVKQANGQPLTDKRSGRATLAKWEKQNEALRSARSGIEVTKRAIEREESKIQAVASVELPAAIRKLLDAGILTQWRKHPNMFFVEGVDRGRIVWRGEGQELAHRYVREIPADQYAKFRDTYNTLRRELKEAA